MSLLPTLTITRTSTTATVSIAEAFTEIVTREQNSVDWTETKTPTGSLASISTSSVGSSYAVDHVVVHQNTDIEVLLEMPLTCENIHTYWSHHYNTNAGRYNENGADYIYYLSPILDGPSPNPDIAGIGVGISYSRARNWQC
jgi:hypothetical protein